jgi:hypothetical protein
MIQLLMVYSYWLLARECNSLVLEMLKKILRKQIRQRIGDIVNVKNPNTIVTKFYYIEFRYIRLQSTLPCSSVLGCARNN